MPVNTYEGMFLLDNTKTAVNWDESVHHVHGILTKYGSEVIASRQWDDRKLAYAVGNHKRGTYLLTYFKVDGSKLKEITSDCKISEVILRELVLKVHPKLAEACVSQAMAATPSVEDEERSEHDGHDERPRGRRRRDD